MNKIRVLGTFPLAMLTVSAIISLRNLSISAEYGSNSIFYLILAAVIFFIPIALVTAELATGWPKAGATYAWVSEAFGKPTGFFALWVILTTIMVEFESVFIVYKDPLLRYCLTEKHIGNNFESGMGAW